MDNELSWIHTDFGDYQPYAKIKLDPVEASRLGISKSILGINLTSSFNGTPLTTLWEGDYAIPVILKSERENNQSDFQSLQKRANSNVNTGSLGSVKTSCHPDTRLAALSNR